MADGTGAGASLVERAKRIILEPKAEWDRIDAEPMTVGGIFTGWVMILAAIPVVCSFIGMLVFGLGSAFGITIRPPVSFLIVNAVTTYVFIISGIFLYGLLIDALAPTFQGTQNRVQAMKVAAFSATPAFLAGVLGLIPQLFILTFVAALYGVYLQFLGLPKLMKSPEDKAIPYVVSVIVAGIVIGVIAGVLIGVISNAVTPAPALLLS